MRIPTALISLSAAALAASGCSDDAAVTNFTVTIQNVSTPGTIASDRAMGTVPLSPGAYAVFDGDDPVFEVGQAADAGTILIAEDGFPMTKVDALAALNLAGSGIFESPGGPLGPALEAGATASFSFSASPGDRLQIETMFVQSNDWFFGFSGGGLELFDGNEPISGDVTGQLALYDAGSEEDTAPGTGPDQKPAQSETATNQGPPDDDASVRLASTSGFTIPANASVIRVTVTPVQ